MIDKIKIGMPHLNFNGLDPVWLFKTLGDRHWSMLNDITAINKDNQRLYASFFGCEVNFNRGQDFFVENSELTFQSNIFKFNNLIYRSTHAISVSDNTATATFDSIFVKKDLASGGLVKDEPISNGKKIDQIDTVFLDEHKRIKREMAEVDCSNFNKLTFSPELYFNGVKILYFANYLNLVLLSEYLTFNKILNPLKKINIYYFKNIEVTDEVYGKTIQKDNNTYETILLSNGKAIAYCLTKR